MTWNQLLSSERPRTSTSPGDHRAEFERDYDRTVFSTPVKRLQDKAQVFPLDPHDAVRTRLTHSMEVSSVARGLGIAIGKWLLEGKLIEPGMDRWIETICSTCGLVHDLGNPPFGHSGEDAIRHWFHTRFGDAKLRAMLGGREQLAQDFLKFEGNAQSLRLLTRLQILADFNGLNLTYGTLSASCKYTASSDQAGDVADHAKSKPGYFASEAEVVARIRSKTGTGDARNPLTYLVEAADDIVYSVADVEDAVKKGLLSWRTIEEILKAESAPVIARSLASMERILKAGRTDILGGLPDDIYASAFRTAAIGAVVEASVKTFKAHYDEILAGTYTGELVDDCEAVALTRVLKEIGRTRVYCTPSNLKLELMGRRVICDLMDIFWEGAESLPTTEPPKAKTFPGKAGILLSENYRSVFRESANSGPQIPELYFRLQLVTDHVCGMTDSFAKRLHTELMNG
jgi:dGTPase